jgi:Methyltransferase domain
MADEILDSVRSKYGAVAQRMLSSNHDGVKAVAEEFGYSADELTSIPAEANMGLSCGNPTATANLRPGEVVVDLGSGGGLDVFLAAKKVGADGRAIGIDMTPAMIERARANAISLPSSVRLPACSNRGAVLPSVTSPSRGNCRKPLPAAWPPMSGASRVQSASTITMPVCVQLDSRTSRSWIAGQTSTPMRRSRINPAVARRGWTKLHAVRPHLLWVQR